MEHFVELEKALRAACPGMELRAQEPMSRHTTFRVGGPVRLMVLPRTAEEAAAVVKTAARFDIAPFFMGNGSNLLVSDRGADVLAVKTVDTLKDITLDGCVITAGSGVLLVHLANFALEHGLTGLEFAHGIPGSLGGALTMNAGAYDGEMAQVVTRVTCLTPGGEVEEIPASACDFSYRHSAFGGGERMILRAELTLTPGDKEEIRAKMEDLAQRRRSKQPLEYPSGGSTFKRPAGHFAAALIDGCGLKGLSVGGAQVSEKHAGFLINRGGATCEDILTLIDRVRETVLRETGVELELELKTLGL